MGVPGFPWVRESAYLLWGNLNTDLRDGFVWFDRLPTFEAIETFTPRVAVSGFADGVVQWNTPQGVFWMPPSEGPVALRDMLGNIEKETYSYKGQTVKPGQIVLDCGAHLGSFVRFALNKGAATVIAIEPSALKVACLRKTFASEVALGRVRVEQVGVWSKEDKLWLAGDPSLVNSVLEGRPGVGHGEWVRTLPIDQLVKELNLPRVDFIKMDIEGAETEALKGAYQTIKKFHPFLAIGTEHTADWAANTRSVISVIQGTGVEYRLGFGRYGSLPRKPAAPMEVFFY